MSEPSAIPQEIVVPSPTSGGGDAVPTSLAQALGTSARRELTEANTPNFSPQLLREYFDHLFPYKEMFRWLSYGNDPESSSALTDKNYFRNREFSFTLEDDIYVRYRSFANKEEFRQAVLQRCPIKIDIGAVYNAPPTMHNSVNFFPKEKELVFDIDMTDYNNVRYCCDEANICGLCWPFMTAAIKVLDAALREDFGFEHLLWVYSGRRGVHCWVCDERARHLSNDARSAIVTNLTVALGGGQNDAEQLINMHPAIQRAYDILEPYFVQVCVKNQGLFDRPERWLKVLEMVPHSELRETLVKKWETSELSGMDRWIQLKKSVDVWSGKKPTKDAVGKNDKQGIFLKACIAEIIFAHIYPRLDANVSKQLHHLLKSPFVVHPKTGRVCVPIDPSDCDNFHPTDVPSLRRLHAELNDKAVTPDQSGDIGKNTSMKPYLQFFRQSFLAPMIKEQSLKNRDIAMQQLDF